MHCWQHTAVLRTLPDYDVHKANKVRRNRSTAADPRSQTLHLPNSFLSPSSSHTSYAQPDPNCVRPAVCNSWRSFPTPPKSRSIASAMGPGAGEPPPPGFILSQKKVWFHTWKRVCGAKACGAGVGQDTRR